MSKTFDDMIADDPDLRRSYELIRNIGNESERGMVILVAAELDRGLEMLLRAYLASGKWTADLLDSGASPLGSFSSKINLARALDLIRHDEYVALHLIRRVRNEFAHDPHASFNQPNIKSWMSQIRTDTPDREPKASFELFSVQLIRDIECNAVDSARKRLEEERVACTFYRRGHEDSIAPSF